MFDIGFLELFLVAVTALVVLGPERLPQAAKTLGGWVAKSRGFANGIRDELEREANLSEIREQLKKEKEKFQGQIQGLEVEKRKLLGKVEQSINVKSPIPTSSDEGKPGPGKPEAGKLEAGKPDVGKL